MRNRFQLTRPGSIGGPFKSEALVRNERLLGRDFDIGCQWMTKGRVPWELDEVGHLFAFGCVPHVERYCDCNHLELKLRSPTRINSFS